MEHAARTQVQTNLEMLLAFFLSLFPVLRICGICSDYDNISVFLKLTFLFPFSFFFLNHVLWLPRDRKDRIIKVRIVLRCDRLNCYCNRSITQVAVGEQKCIALTLCGKHLGMRECVLCFKNNIDCHSSELACIPLNSAGFAVGRTVCWY